MKTPFAQGFPTSRYRAGCWSGCKDAIYARRTHFVVAFGVDEELEGGIEVSVRFADWADVVGGIIPQPGNRVARHLAGSVEVVASSRCGEVEDEAVALGKRR